MRTFFLMLATFMLVSCSYSTALIFLNGSSQDVTVIVRDAGNNDREDHGRVASGAIWRSQTPEAGEGWLVEIIAGECRTSYVVPSPVRAPYPWRDVGVDTRPSDAAYIRLRITDRSLELIPFGPGPVERAIRQAEGQSLEIAGFPLRPAEESCAE
jgi:hypothetical protein